MLVLTRRQEEAEGGSALFREPLVGPALWMDESIISMGACGPPGASGSHTSLSSYREAVPGTGACGGPPAISPAGTRRRGGTMGGAMTRDHALGNLSLRVRIALKLRSPFVGEDHNHHRPNIYSGMCDTVR